MFEASRGQWRVKLSLSTAFLVPLRLSVSSQVHHVECHQGI